MGEEWGDERAEAGTRKRDTKGEAARRIEDRADHAGVIEPAQPGGE